MTERDGELRGGGVIPSSALAKWLRDKHPEPKKETK